MVCPILTGRGQGVLVSGEAGIGKSRLIAEVQVRAHQSGGRVLHGHCFEPDRTLPCAPLQDLLPSMPITQSPQAIIDALVTLHLVSFDNRFWMSALGEAGV
jgi:predicted ATPase